MIESRRTTSHKGDTTSTYVAEESEKRAETQLSIKAIAPFWYLTFNALRVYINVSGYRPCRSDGHAASKNALPTRRIQHRM